MSIIYQAKAVKFVPHEDNYRIKKDRIHDEQSGEYIHVENTEEANMWTLYSWEEGDLSSTQAIADFYGDDMELHAQMMEVLLNQDTLSWARRILKTKGVLLDTAWTLDDVVDTAKRLDLYKYLDNSDIREIGHVIEITKESEQGITWEGIRAAVEDYVRDNNLEEENRVVPRPLLTDGKAKDAMDWLLSNITHDTVIDPNWFGYFFKDTRPLTALLTITGLNSYEDILNYYEGYDITDLKNLFDECDKEVYDVGWTIEFSGVEQVKADDFEEASDKVSADVQKNYRDYMRKSKPDTRTYKF